LNDTLKREKASLGFYVSGHPLDRYGAGLGRFDVEPVAALRTMDPWSRVRVAGTVEGYRERIFRSGGKVAFFELEDLTGPISVKVREKQLDHAGVLLSTGEPVLVTGKLQFPMDDGDGDAGAKEPTLLLDEVALLSEAIRAETRSIAIRLTSKQAERGRLARLNELLHASPGGCPVQLIIETEVGEALLAMPKDVRVEPSDAMLASLERLFGQKVAELR